MPDREKITDSVLSFRMWADLVIVLGFLGACSTYLPIDQDHDGSPVVLTAVLILLGYLMGTAYRSMVWLLRDRPGRAAAGLVKLAVVLLPCPFGVAVGGDVHLALYYPGYRRQIGAQGDGNTAPVRSFWGDKALWVTDGLQADTLVYDPTDALAKAVDEVRDTGQPGVGLATRHLIGHLYVEREFPR